MDTFDVIVYPLEPTELWILGSLCIVFPFLGGGVCGGRCYPPPLVIATQCLPGALPFY